MASNQNRLPLIGVGTRNIALYSPCEGSGKTEVANVLKRRFGFKAVKFAGVLKAMTFVFLKSAGFDEETVFRMIDGDLKNIDSIGPGLSPRRVMQTLGTEWGRDCIAESIWTDLAVGQATTLNGAGSNVIIDDLRFPNEYDALVAKDFEIWKIVRPGTIATTDHPSEGLLDHHEFDVVIENDGTLEDLHRKIAFHAKQETVANA